MRTVRIMDVPAAEFVRLQHHVDDLLREFEIIEIGATSATVPVPQEVWAVTSELLGRYADTRASAWQQAAAAEQAGTVLVDLEVTMPTSAADDVEQLQRLFERADDLSRAGVLLTPEPAPALVKLRRRIAEEITAALRAE